MFWFYVRRADLYALASFKVLGFFRSNSTSPPFWPKNAATDHPWGFLVYFEDWVHQCSDKKFLSYSTLTTDQRIQVNFQCKIFSKMYTQWERRKPLRVDGFPANFFSPYPREFLSHSHPNDAILHSPKKPLCSALHSKISIQKEGIFCLVEVKYSNDS